MSIWIKILWEYLKSHVLATCNVELQVCLQEQDDVIPAHVSCSQMSVTAILQHPACLHVAKKRWCSLGNHSSNSNPHLPVPEGAMFTWTYSRRTFKTIPVSTLSCHVPTPRSYYTQCIFHKCYVQVNIPSIVFTKLPCTTIAAWCLWKGTPTALYHSISVGHSIYIQECHRNVFTETTASGDTLRWTTYSIHLQKVTSFCKALCIFTYTPLFWMFHENSWSDVTGLVGAFVGAPETDGGR